MKRILKIFLFIGVLLLVGGFIAFKKITDNSLPKDIVGTYVCEIPGFVERKIILVNNNLKGSYFSTSKDTLHIKENFTHEYISYNTKNRPWIRHGSWSIQNDSLILFFPENNLEEKFTSLSFFDELYNLGEMTPCRDTMARVPWITSFKKIK